ncbi:DUF3379 family protein [Veronia pacifica]|uniref:DUF3379 domain-containing protein n=1 Tax=Veronia pacifica TaxID=1080227 RepID=A0A1C3EAI5_9GAMM|nr:DUF3379 family protein [Veronia pacifica]ODA30252.1 hypothetical protein A8L45_20490 [Veronia pacifica]
MDELEFRRRVLSNPQDKDPEILEMRRASASNDKYVQELEQLDELLDETFRVDVPDDLADKIIFKQSSEVERENRRPKFYMSIAASIAFVFGIVIGQFNWSQQSLNEATIAKVTEKPIDSLGQMALKHYYGEVPFTGATNERATLERVNLKLSPFGQQFKGGLPGKITYVNHCAFGELGPGLHVDIQTDEGKKMTFFIVRTQGAETESFSDEKMNVVMKQADKNRLIVIGEKGAHVEQVAEKLKHNLFSI